MPNKTIHEIAQRHQQDIYTLAGESLGFFTSLLAKAVKGATYLPLGAGGFIHGITSFRNREKRVISPFINPQQKEFENCQRLQRVFQKKFEINAKMPD